MLFDLQGPLVFGLPINNIEFTISLLLMGSPYIVGTWFLTFKVPCPTSVSASTILRQQKLRVLHLKMHYTLNL